MAFQSVPDTAAFTAHFEGPDGVTPSFTLYSRNTAAPWDASQLSLLAGDLITAITDDYMPVVSNEFTFTHVTSRDLEVEFGRTGEHLPGAPVVGGLAVASLPAQVAVRGTFIGNPGAPPARGGIYMLPPTEAQVDGNLLTAAATTALQDALEALHNAMSAVGPAHVIISRYAGTQLVDLPDGQRVKRPVKRGVALTNTVPTVIVRRRVDSQRKRRPAEAA